MATWEDVRDAVLGSDELRDYMFDYLWKNGRFGDFSEDDALWFFNASMGYIYPGTGHRQNSETFCKEFLPEYESITSQQSPGEDSAVQ